MEMSLGDRQFQQMIAEVEDYAIIFLDLTGHIQSWNRGAERIKGYQAHEILGGSYKLFYPQEDLEHGVPDMLLQQARTEGKANHEGWRKRKDGSLFWGSVVITALHDETGNIIGFLKLTRDLTERKKAEDSLKAKNQELEKLNAELSSFAYVVSHDLKEPVRKIQLFAGLQNEADRTPEQIKTYSSKISAAATRMRSMMDALLNYATHAEDIKPEDSLDLNMILEEVKVDLEVLIEEKEAVIVSENLPRVRAVAVQMHQLLLNIVSNALKFNRPGISPRINITGKKIKRKELPEELTGSQEAYYRITFSDNGLGFNQKQSGKIFEVFRRLNSMETHPGTGIGLSIVKRVAENHGGLVWAEGRPNEGADFHVFLPASLILD